MVGDDLFVTNSPDPQARHPEGIANSILIKVNQIGTLTETLNAIKMAADAATLQSPPPLRRNRGQHHRRPGRGHRQPDQDRSLSRSDRVAKGTTGCW